MSFIWVFIGGGIGAIGRYMISLMLPRSPDTFPWATLTVNVIGALLIGLLAGLLLGRDGGRLFLVVGVLGGFTTFSTFSLEILQLIQNRDLASAVIYVLVSVFAGVVACWIGMRAVGYA